MNLSNQIISMFLKGIFLGMTIFCLSACESEVESTNNKPVLVSSPTEKETVIVQKEAPVISEPEIENKSYLFVVKNHSIEELEALLARAEAVSQSKPEDFEDLEIVMVIHGPDIDFFTNQNHENNSQLLDVAARLDAFNVIDMKVCETTMIMRGVERQDIPSFIESVPFAPTEIKQRLQDGYINL
ncbi:MAG: intracellular sulfur oxidation DsrE/DsrF family protein [Gammaproteobacteria bacterium]|jgi:intracellular sulfur oxidation DsrE/DsrF family protein